LEDLILHKILPLGRQFHERGPVVPLVPGEVVGGELAEGPDRVAVYLLPEAVPDLVGVGSVEVAADRRDAGPLK